MKKFYFLMLAMIVSFAAQAWNVKFTNPNGWAKVYVWAWDGATNYTGGTWPGAEMTKSGDVWVYEGEGAPSQIIFNGGNGQPQTADLAFVDGATYDMLGVAGAEVINLKFYVPVSQYNYATCNIYSWMPELFGTWPGSAMTKVTENGNDFWTYEFETTSAEVAVAGWKLNGGDTDTDDLPSITLKNGYVYNLDGTSVALADYVGGEVTDEVSYVLRGQIFGNEDWEDYAMTNNNGVWTVSGTAVAGQFGIKEVKNFAQTGWWSSPEAGNITEAGTYAISAEGTANFTSTLTGDITISFDPAAGTLKVEGGEVVPVDYTSWYLNVPGTFNNWNADGVAFSAEGLATASALPIGAGEFKLKIWNGVEDVWLSNGEMVAVDTPYVVAGNSDVNMTIEGAGDGDLYDITFDVVTYTMTVKKSIETGIANIAAEAAPVEYFNLQGIRVENPVNGLYIRRQGNNVAKVLVK